MKSLLLFSIILLISCTNAEENPVPIIGESEIQRYFPPINSDEWSNSSPESLGWNTEEIANLIDFLETNNTRAFIILKDGKIVIEEYFGLKIIGNGVFDKDSFWYWASAGKTLTATLVGIAQQEGDLNIANSTSDYLGVGWTSLAVEVEQLIKVSHQLTMTTGLNYLIDDLNCTLPSCLTYKSNPGEQWYYHNAPYTLLERVVERATGMDYNEYTDKKIESVVGMSGQWIQQGYNNVYWSTARDMARFGLLILSKGQWDNSDVLSDTTYYDQMVNTSQQLNPAYGYLWWLNGKEYVILPGLPSPVNIELSVHAPDDLFAGMGKNGQIVAVVPSKGLVVIRMGEAPDDSLVPITFHDQMWEKINAVLNK